MAQPANVVAVLIANPALRSILSMVLAASPALRVRPFETQLALITYMRLAPVDLVVTDFDSRDAPPDEVSRALRSSGARRGVQIIALASTVSRDTKELAVRVGIDEIIVKPMSPKYLLERVLARLQRVARVGPHVPAEPRQPLAGPALVPRNAKVVPLFGHRTEPQP